ncbi:threonine/homoserine/homoserine lactone efflux protein [Salibacterium salarium]|uniref:LysE family translocator n=1 Tax=Salibacterium salarium TaxID=284579 RepID=UPI002780D0AD|nr:LysE family translocator [Salibacterium salarium]MDQ0300566.1 threonine/homoserine/homoserine lactone efflux protein [Salibacterium salarium]
MDTLPVFAVASFGLLISPGADMILLTNNTLNKGRKAGIITLFGTLSGALIHILLVVLGISTIIQASPILYGVLKWGGALYLIYVGGTTLKHAMTKPVNFLNSLDHHPNNNKTSAVYGQAFLINVLNPKVVIFFMGYFPQFISNEENYTFELIQLGALFLLIGFLWMVTYTFFISILRPLLLIPVIQRTMNGLTGLLFIFIALFILISA